MNNQLVLMQNDIFHGLVGEETEIHLNGHPICVGDTVKVISEHSDVEIVNVVFQEKQAFKVMGIHSAPIEKLNIVEICKSHTSLQAGDQLKFRLSEITTIGYSLQVTAVKTSNE
ncbi:MULTISPECIES: hypothetical protein [Bacillus cereus group]|uniref:hypothetical protein n=1 Tax=Bacillus cereus group TaxID=86661 RepID=UPI001F59C47F|nr:MULTISPECIES: hypothetical protein [Bacillus cereus group]HDR7922326.1 hypothetical protein [Bacillus paranthracis]